MILMQNYAFNTEFNPILGDSPGIYPLFNKRLKLSFTCTTSCMLPACFKWIAWFC